MVYSDGLAAVSVFIEPRRTRTPDQRGPDASGRINIYTRTINDQVVTVLGEAPASTVMQIGNSVSFRATISPASPFCRIIALRIVPSSEEAISMFRKLSPYPCCCGVPLLGCAQVQGLPDFTDLVEKQGPAVVNVSTTSTARGGAARPRCRKTIRSTTFSAASARQHRATTKPARSVPVSSSAPTATS